MACVTLPVFFYNHPQRPGEVLSLHLFEPRYREMIRRGHKQFLYHPVGTGAASVGKQCRVLVDRVSFSKNSFFVLFACC